MWKSACTVSAKSRVLTLLTITYGTKPVGTRLYDGSFSNQNIRFLAPGPRRQWSGPSYSTISEVMTYLFISFYGRYTSQHLCSKGIHNCETILIETVCL